MALPLVPSAFCNQTSIWLYYQPRGKPVDTACHVVFHIESEAPIVSGEDLDPFSEQYIEIGPIRGIASDVTEDPAAA